ncbi:hypothetical protein ENBRE01_1448 [Enteropsectra breve]|nr:hypothetical protein ENBRE01_1448 [Enteropsectra breve]
MVMLIGGMTLTQIEKFKKDSMPECNYIQYPKKSIHKTNKGRIITDINKSIEEQNDKNLTKKKSQHLIEENVMTNIKEIMHEEAYDHNDESDRDDSYISTEQKKEMMMEINRIGKTKSTETAEIDTEPSRYASTYRPIKPHHLPIVKELVAELEKLGFMEKTSACKWLIPTRIVPKANGKFRFCQDLTELNKLVEQDNYPIPDVHQIFDACFGKKIFTVLDISNGFFQVPLRNTDREKTTCKIGHEFYRFKVLPMGFKNSPAIFQRIMDSILKDFVQDGSVRIYIDDILIMTESLKDHIKITKQVLTRLKEYGMEINVDKVRLAKRSIDFLGHTLSENMLKPLDDRIRQILKLPEPNSTRAVRGFLGQVNYLGRHIRDLSALKAPLNEFTRKGVTFKWESRHQEAFDELKRAVAHYVSTALPDPKKEFTIETDASNTGIGAVLKQEEKIIAFYSSRLNTAQQHYTITEKEFLAVIKAMGKWEHYLLGKHFTVITDHKAIEAYFNKRDQEFGTDRIMRWSQVLENFNFTPVYRRGEDMHIADALSRSYENNSIKENKKINSLEQNITEQVLKIHKEMDHRKSITKEVIKQGINITASELRKILDKCQTCQEYSNTFTKSNTYINSNYPGELVGIDLMEYNNLYIIVIIDYFSRFVYTKYVKTKEAHKIVEFVSSVYKVLKIKTIIADCGKEFKNSLMLEWMKENKVEHYFRPPYYHAGTGRVERVIQTLRNAIRKTKGSVITNLKNITKTYNNSYHRALQMTPSMALQENNKTNVLKAAEEYKKEFKDTESPELKLGQKVLVRKEIRDKDDRHFENIGVITSKVGHKSYEIHLEDGRKLHRHFSQLKCI